MKLKLKLSISLSVIFLTIFGLPVSNFAYVLTGPHLLELMAEKMGPRKKGLEIEQTLFLYSDNADESEIKDYKFKETVYFKFPKRFRSEVLTDDFQQIHVFSFGLVLNIVDDKITSTHESLGDLYKDPFLNESRQALIDLLTLHKIDVSVSSLGRFQGKIAFVIGAKAPDETLSQLWIDKETFLPMRWLIVSSEDDQLETFEIRYALWQPAGQDKYPRRIEFFKNSKLIRMILVKAVKPDIEAPDTLFNIAQLKKTYQNETLENENKPAEDPDILQNLIDDFKKRLPGQ